MFFEKNKEIVTISFVKNPSEIDQVAARDVLVESFIGEYSRYLQPQDVDESLTTWRGEEASVQAFYRDYFESEFEEFSEQHLDFWVQAHVNGVLVGWATFEREKSNERELYMNLLVVHPQHQRQGVGQKLTMSLLNHGVIPDLSAMHVLLRKKNVAGRNFYTKLGFAVDETYRREGNFVDMELLEAISWHNPKLVQQSEKGSEQDECKIKLGGW